SDPIYITNLEQRNVSLHQNYPNPFREETTFAFDLASSANVRISIFDMMGRELATVANRQYTAGSHEINWNIGNLSPGQYFYKIQTDHYVEVKSMLIVK
ncbi:MAG: T9SS type A sorting domain-containing protein, partial [Bacteroidales bacterium]|nr:T9SS type A sorting domain-containing protein [Bacteroidales bacterium]